MKLSTQYLIRKYCNGVEQEVLDDVVVEHEVVIVVNDQIYKTILCSPSSLEALVIGELISEEIIFAIEDISKLIIKKTKDITKIYVTCIRDNYLAMDYYKKNRENLVGKTQILTLFQSFVSSSILFKATGGVHTCAIANNSGVLYQEDDISRQNAIKKVIGLCYKNDISLDNQLLFTSCRISSEIMKIVVSSGIRTVVSKSAPTNVAIDLARKNGITLFGFVRGNSMNRYC